MERWVFFSWLCVLPLVVVAQSNHEQQSNNQPSTYQLSDYTTPGTLSLTPVQLEDVSDTEIDIPDAKEESSVERVDSESELNEATTKKLTTQQRRQIAKQQQLERLQRPVGMLAVRGALGQSLGPSANSSAVSRESSTGSDENIASRLITMSRPSSLPELEQTTIYERRPLYFEDAALERCGQSDGWLRVGVWTNGRSALRFMVDTVKLPVRMFRQHPNHTVSSTAD